ncbi:MAG: radical SAM protein [Deltaproteobacteria bacterium]|nr:radical SAM protein [Deltaproteobacteria bacterium]
MSARGLKPLIVPIFIPHEGCPYRCVFCDQEKITSRPSGGVDGEAIESVLKGAVKSKGFYDHPRREVAFYGGTFTRLPKDRIKALLKAVAPYIGKGHFHAIRVSTRPDAIDKERLEIMKGCRVDTVELGAQSMDDDVLSLSKRGHSAGDTRQSVHILRRYGFKVGIQLMPGLPGDSIEKFRSTITQVIALCPDVVRLYPALAIDGTTLALWHREGTYRPLGLGEAVEICAESCMRLEAENIPVIRIGVMSSPSLLEKGRIVAGPWHPAFGFLVRSNIYLRGIEAELTGPGPASRIIIRAPRREIPLLRGYRNEGLKRIKDRTGAEVIHVQPDDALPAGKIRIEKA